MKGVRFWVLTLVVEFTLLALMPSSHAKADDGSIVGTWILVSTLAPGFTNTELIAFNPGGTLTTASTVFNAHSSQNPFLPPFLTIDTSGGYGAWKPQGDSNQFALTFKRHLFAGVNTPTAFYGPFFVGQDVGEGTIQAVATLHGEDGVLEGQFTFQARNLRGDVVGTGSGPFSATRLQITASNTVVATVPVPNPGGVAITPNGAFAYVTNGANTVSVIDTATNLKAKGGRPERG